MGDPTKWKFRYSQELILLMNGRAKARRRRSLNLHDERAASGTSFLAKRSLIEFWSVAALYSSKTARG
jgi:hypothetical protein